MSELKRTILYQAHLDAGATMVDFGGWDMPIQYPEGIIAEHLYCRSVTAASLTCPTWDGSTSKAPIRSRSCSMCFPATSLRSTSTRRSTASSRDKNGYAIDDAYLYRFEEGKYFLVINAGNIDKDWAHLTNEAKNFDVKLTNVSDKYAAIAVQGPESKKILMTLSRRPAADARERQERAEQPRPWRASPSASQRPATPASPSATSCTATVEDARYFWDRLIELGAQSHRARRTRHHCAWKRRCPLYGHEMGECEMGGEIQIVRLCRWPSSPSPSTKPRAISSAANRSKSSLRRSRRS